MLNFIKKNINTEFSRNVATLVTGTTIAQAVPIATAPILTRLYTPEDFGIFALYMSIADILSSIATAKYDMAIVLPKENKKAINILSLSVITTLSISFLSLLIVIIFNSQITNLLGNPKISKWLYWVPLSVLFTGLYTTFNFWMNRNKRYGKMSKSKITETIGMSSTKLSLGYFNFGALGLIFGQIFSQIGASLYYIYIFILRDFFKLKSFINKKEIKAVAKEHKKFTLITLPSTFIGNLKNNFQNILISKLFSTSILGQYAWAMKIISLPTTFIGGAIGNVFLQQISSLEKKNIYDTCINFAKKMALISFFPFCCIYFFSEPFFEFIFGEEWVMAGKIASILTPLVFFNFIASPLSQVFQVINKQEITLITNIFSLTSTILILYLSSNLFIALKLLVGVNIFFIITVFFYLFNTLNKFKIN